MSLYVRGFFNVYRALRLCPCALFPVENHEMFEPGEITYINQKCLLFG